MPLDFVGVGDQRDLDATDKGLDDRQDVVVDAEIAGPNLEEGLRIHHLVRSRGLADGAPKFLARQNPAVQGIPQNKQALADHLGRGAAVLGQAAAKHVVVVKGQDVAQIQEDDFDSRHVAQASCTGRNCTSTIWYSRLPLPVRRVTVSPFSRPMRARASGAEMARRPSLMSPS